MCPVIADTCAVGSAASEAGRILTVFGMTVGGDLGMTMLGRTEPASETKVSGYPVGSSTMRSVVMMANRPSASRTGTERVIIQTSPPPASK